MAPRMALFLSLGDTLTAGYRPRPTQIASQDALVMRERRNSPDPATTAFGTRSSVRRSTNDGAGTAYVPEITACDRRRVSPTAGLAEAPRPSSALANRRATHRAVGTTRHDWGGRGQPLRSLDQFKGALQGNLDVVVPGHEAVVCQDNRIAVQFGDTLGQVETRSDVLDHWEVRAQRIGDRSPRLRRVR